MSYDKEAIQAYGRQYQLALDAFMAFTLGRADRSQLRMALDPLGLGHTSPAQALIDYLDPSDPPPGYIAKMREAVDHAAAAHPLLVDALYRADKLAQPRRRHIWEKRFRIATYSGFYRPEIKSAMAEQDTAFSGPLYYGKTALVVPCSADKPYPSEEHKVYMQIVDDPRYCELVDLVVCSTAIGPIHRSTWANLPEYDSGLPLFDRLRFTVASRLCGYRDVILHTDMLTNDLWSALQRVDVHVTGFSEHQQMEHRMLYSPLTDPGPLDRLRRKLQELHP